MTYLTCAETAKLIRTALKEAFPGMKFSVKSSTYSGGASISVGWTDGPTVKMVDSVVGVFEGSYFDGMTDYKGSTYAMIDGEQVRFGADSVHTSRRTTRALLEQVKAMAIRRYGDRFESLEIKDCGYDDSAYFVRDYSRTDDHWLAEMLYKFTTYRTPHVSKTAARVIYLGNDGYSQVGALQVE